MNTVGWIFSIVGIVVFTVGMTMWSEYRRDWHDSIGLGLAAGGLVLLLLGAIAMIFQNAPS